MHWRRYIDNDLLLIKLHYFLAFAAAAPLSSFLMVIGKQRGYSAFVMGFMFTVLDIATVLIRLVIGPVTDAYQCRKLMFLASQCLMAIGPIVLLCLPGAIASENLDDNAVLRTWLFWIFVCASFVLKTGLAIRVVLEDTICMNLLGDNLQNYGQHRVWGAFGYGILSVVTGLSIDWLSKGQVGKNYTPGYLLSIICSAFDIFISSKIKVVQLKKNEPITGNIKNIVTDFKVITFMGSVICFGFFWPFVMNFKFWYLEDLANFYHPETKSWIKTLQGISLTIQCLLGEVPFYFLSSYLIKKLGHVNVYSISFITLSIRFLLYSIITNPVWTLSVDILHGITFALMHAATISHAASLARPGAEGSMQGLTGIALTGIGYPLGDLAGGYLIKNIGTIISFRLLSILAFIVCTVQVIINWILRRMYKNEQNKSQP